MNTGAEILSAPVAAGAPKRAQKPSANWSKTKQRVRRMSAEAYREEELQEWKQERKEEKFREKEVRKAKQLLGADFTGEPRRSARGKTV
jgi:hypothetical protein